MNKKDLTKHIQSIYDKVDDIQDQAVNLARKFEDGVSDLKDDLSRVKTMLEEIPDDPDDITDN